MPRAFIQDVVAVAAVSQNELLNTPNKNLRAYKPILPICQIARRLHAPIRPKHGAALRSAQRLEVSEQTGMDFAIGKHAYSTFTLHG